MDSRLKLLSHSSSCSLHSCPRRYQLTKVSPQANKEETVHTSFGKLFGEGIQTLLAGGSLQDAVLHGILLWTMDLDDEHKGKSVWTAIAALENFSVIKHTTALEDYEVATFNGRQACELSFCIALPGGYYYRGYVDVVLRHKVTGTYLVVDVKSSGATHSNPLKYTYSAQAIGYSVVIDKIAPQESQYDVMYYEYLVPTKKFVEHVHVVDNLQRAQWLRNILIDTQLMEVYDQFPEWPMHGESCVSYNRPCQFIDVCTMTTASITAGRVADGDAMQYDKEQEYDVMVTFDELIESQMSKSA